MLQLNKKLQSYRPLALSNVTILFLLLLIYHIISYQPCGYCERLMYGFFFFLKWRLVARTLRRNSLSTQVVFPSLLPLKKPYFLWYQPRTNSGSRFNNNSRAYSPWCWVIWHLNSRRGPVWTDWVSYCLCNKGF